MSSLLSVLKIAFFYASVRVPPNNETTVNLKSISFIVFMLSHKGLPHIQSQIQPWLLFGESFTLICNEKTGKRDRLFLIGLQPLVIGAS